MRTDAIYCWPTILNSDIVGLRTWNDWLFLSAEFWLCRFFETVEISACVNKAPFFVKIKVKIVAGPLRRADSYFRVAKLKWFLILKLKLPISRIDYFLVENAFLSRVWLIVKVKVLEVIIIETVIQAFHWLTTPHSIFQRIEKHSRIQISFNNAQLSKPFHNATSFWPWVIYYE